MSIIWAIKEKGEFNMSIFNDKDYEKDLYEVLGVTEEATQSEIKEAYRKLAASLHPDLPGNRARAKQEELKAVNAAYDILGNLHKRAIYDQMYARHKEEQKRKDNGFNMFDPNDPEIARYKKMAEEKAEQMKKEAGPNKYRLDRKEIGGKVEAPIDTPPKSNKKWIKIAIIGGMVVTISLSAFGLGRLYQKADDVSHPTIEEPTEKDDEKEKGVLDKRVPNERNESPKEEPSIMPEVPKQEDPAVIETLKQEEDSEKGEKENGTKPSTSTPKEEKPNAKPSQNNNQSAGGQTPKPVENQKPVENKPEVDQTPTVSQIEQEKITRAVDSLYANWQNQGLTYSKEYITEMVKCLNKMDSSLTISDVDYTIQELLNTAITPGINNAIAGYDAYKTCDVNLSSLIISDKEGLSTVASMEYNLNGALTDSSNLMIYGERAFTQEAQLLELGYTLDGFNPTSNGVNPALRLIWARLAIAMNGFAGTLGDDLKVEVDGRTYSQAELNNSTVFEELASLAKKDLGETSKNLNLK